MRLFGLIGKSLTHSFSKNYFTKKFEQEGITDCRYELFPLDSIREFPSLLAAYPELEGLNVTIPYKKDVIAYLDDRSGIPAGLEACNCIRIRNGKKEGFNTDHTGFEKSFSPGLSPDHQHALVLGNGGATAAVVHVLQKLGITYEVVSREMHEGSTLTYQQLTPELIQTHTVIINTTPLGMYPASETFPPIPYEHLSPAHYLYDLVYNPSETLFMKKGMEHGAHVSNGADMLVIQAEESWKIWNEGK